MPVCDLEQLVQLYLTECELQLYSPRTLEVRHGFIRNFLWFLQHRGYSHCSESEIRQFLHYLLHGHEEAGGRFGRKNLTQAVRPITVKDYDVCLRAFFDWSVKRGALTETLFKHIDKPRVRAETKQPLSQRRVLGLLQAAQSSTQPERDTAILSFLLDTGCRASELISITLEQLDLESRCCRVLGKGNKHRTLYFGEETAKALRHYLKATKRLNTKRLNRISNKPFNSPPSDSPRGASTPGTSPLFLSSRTGFTAQLGRPLTRSGLLQLTERLQQRCGFKDSCSPHAFRRSFAVQTLRNGAHVFSVQAMLGHSDLQMTQRYCAIALADVEAQHRQFGPLDRLTSRNEMHLRTQ
ncbi:MAG TPA: tyrosine-type recombinase/integrase [Abditibacteriaceae bacterium]|jgi:site-specific recombinase XerD